MKTTVLLADDHGIVRMGLKSLLETEPDISVIGEARDGDEAVAKALRLKPDVVIMDIVMPEKDGTTATREIRAQTNDIRILLLTSFAASDDLRDALDAGADGAVFKSTADDELADAIRAVAAGNHYLSSAVRQQLKADPPLPQMTERQRMILLSVTRGLSNDEIARQFGIARITVQNHLKVIFEKLGVANRTEAAAFAMRKHLLKA